MAGLDPAIRTRTGLATDAVLVSGNPIGMASSSTVAMRLAACAVRQQLRRLVLLALNARGVTVKVRKRHAEWARQHTKWFVALRRNRTVMYPSKLTWGRLPYSSYGARRALRVVGQPTASTQSRWDTQRQISYVVRPVARSQAWCGYEAQLPSITLSAIESASQCPVGNMRSRCA